MLAEWRVAWLDIKLPTGDADKLTGSGATDVSLALSGRHRLSDRWSIFGQAAGTWLGDGVALTVGGDHLFDSGWRLDLGVSEDLAVEHSPDVVLLLTIKRGPR